MNAVFPPYRHNAMVAMARLNREIRRKCEVVGVSLNRTSTVRRVLGVTEGAHPNGYRAFWSPLNYTTAANAMKIFSNRNMAALTARSEHNLADVGLTKSAVFIITPDERDAYNVMSRSTCGSSTRRS